MIRLNDNGMVCGAAEKNFFVVRSLCLYFCLDLSFGIDIFCRSLFCFEEKNLRPLDGDFIGYMGDLALLLDGSFFLMATASLSMVPSSNFGVLS